MKHFPSRLTLAAVLSVFMAGSAQAQLEVQAPLHFNHLTEGTALGAINPQPETQFSGVGVTSGSAGPVSTTASGYPEATGVMLKSAHIGNSFATGVPRYYLGDEITPPTTEADGATPALVGYWRKAPVRPGEFFSNPDASNLIDGTGAQLPNTTGSSGIPLPELGAGEYEHFYYSLHADRVFAAQAGTVEVLWVSSSPVDGAWKFYKETFNVSGGATGEVRKIFWTEKSFNGPRIDIPIGRIVRVNPIYTSSFPELVVEEYRPVGYVENPDPNAQSPSEKRTLWFESGNDLGQIAAYNKEGRIFVEYLGEETSPGKHEFLGADIIEVKRTPEVVVETIELGQQVLPHDMDTDLIGAPLLNLNTGADDNFYGTRALPNGKLVYDAERENLNPDKIVFYWLEDRDAGIHLLPEPEVPGLSILWPKYQNRYLFIWPNHVEDYVHVVTDANGSSIESGLQFDPASEPEIIFQDDPDQSESYLDAVTRRLVVDLSNSSDGWNRTLLKFSNGNNVWYEAVYSQREGRSVDLLTTSTDASTVTIVTVGSTAGMEVGWFFQNSSPFTISVSIESIIDGTQFTVGLNGLGGGRVPDGTEDLNAYIPDPPYDYKGTYTAIFKTTTTPKKLTVPSTEGLLSGTLVTGVGISGNATIENIVNGTELVLSQDLPAGSYNLTFQVESDLILPIQGSAVVSQRIERPSDLYSLAGAVSGGTGYQASVYMDPYEVGVEAAEAGAIIPVNALPDDNEITVRWFKRIDPQAAGFSPFYVPSKVGHYTVSYPPDLGEWSFVNPMIEERGRHSTTLLQDGRVLVAGGYSYANGPLASAEIYNPATGLWTLTSPMNEASWGHKAILLDNGKVLIVGGGDGIGYLPRAEIFDPSSETWATVDSLSQGRAFHTATLLQNGKVLVAGGVGYIDPSDVSLSSTELYDPLSDTWSTIGSLNEVRVSYTATLLADGRVLVAGGADRADLNTAILNTTAELYDPLTQTWSYASNGPATPRVLSTATLLADGKVLFAGGYAAGLLLNSCELYDPVSGVWSPTANPLFGNRFFHTATLMPDGKVLVAGGYSYFPEFVELYDPLTGLWSKISSINEPRSNHTSTLLNNGSVLLSGGYTPSTNTYGRTAELLESVSKVIMASNQGTVDLTPSQAAGYLYFENDSANIGYNPNEEHGVKLNNRFYALRDDLNVTSGEKYTSEPYLLVAYTDPTDGRPAMRPFRVLRGDTRHTFNYPWTAGTRIQGPMPLPLMELPLLSDGTIANTEVPGDPDPAPDVTGTAPDLYDEFTFEDRLGYKWVYRGPHAGGSHTIGMQWYYPMRPDFFIPDTETQPAEGTSLAYLRPLDGGGIPQGDPVDGTALTIFYSPTWPDATPALRIAETLTLPKFGLPDVRNQKSASVLYQQSIALDGAARPSVVLHDPTRNRSAKLLDIGLTGIPDSIRTSIYQGKTYFQGLPPHLQSRFYFDPLASTNGSLVLSGEFNDEIAGEDYLDLNVLSSEDEDALKALAQNEAADVQLQWIDAINGLTTRLETFIEDPSRQGTYIVDTDTTVTYDVGPYDLPAIPDEDTARDSYALTANGQGDGYVTLFFGNGTVPNLTPQGDPPVMQIIRVIPELYNGDLKVRLSSNPLDEQVTLRHSADFAAEAENYEFEWRYASPTESGIQPPTYTYTGATYLGDPGNASTREWKYFRNPQTALPSSDSYSVDDWSLPRQDIVRNFNYDVIAGQPCLVLKAGNGIDFTSEIPAKIVFSADLGPLDGFVLYVNGSVALVHGNGVTALDNLLSGSVYDLRLAVVTSPEDLPIEGERLFVVADVSGVLHFRVFDAAGIQVVDTNENELTGKSTEIMDLKNRLSTLWATTNLPNNDKIAVVSESAAILEFNLDTDTSNTLSGNGLSKQFSVNGGHFIKGLNTIEVALYTEADPGVLSTIDLRFEGSSKLDQVDPLVFPSSPWQLASGTPVPLNTSIVGGSPTAPMGSPLLLMSDNYFTVRYRAQPFLTDGVTANPAYALTGGAWSDWVRPALVEGWIKRVLAAINPFNQRVTDLFNNAVNTDVSLLTQAGAKWEGDIALTLDAIDDFGLISIYETVLNRGKQISIESGYDYGPANDALLLAAGYLHDLYTILGNEAYADAANPTISIDDQDTITEINTSRFSFEGQVASVLEEELALLRGRDDFLSPQVTQSPFYNRLFWNYTRGIDSGEALYAVNYNIKEKVGSSTEDGSIDAADAQRMFPQGHGDAYGHYLTALKGYYSLIVDPNFTWIPRSESLNILGNTVSVDYQDERKFAEAAANTARTAEQVVVLTHRQQYNNNPANGWDHFRDGEVNPNSPPPNARYWGLDEWISRSAQGTYFNWVVGNAMLPDVDSVNTGIQKIDRTTVPELELLPIMAGSFQTTSDNASEHLNPLGLSPGAIAFDIDPVELKDGDSHYEQVYERALSAVLNAKGSFDQAATMTRLLRNQENQIDEFNTAIEDQERAFSYELIDLYGTPYPGDIGPGKTYAQGYDGPDLINWFVVDRPSDIVDTTEPVTIEARVPVNLQPFEGFNILQINKIADQNTAIREIKISPLALGQFSDNWFNGTDVGSRSITGRVQQALNDAHISYIALLEANARLEDNYLEFNRKGKFLVELIEYHLAVEEARHDSRTYQAQLSATKIGLEILEKVADKKAETLTKAGEALAEAPPTVTGPLANDFTAPLRAALRTKTLAAAQLFKISATIASKSAKGVEALKSIEELDIELLVEEMQFDFEQKQAAYEFEVDLQNILNQYFEVDLLAIKLQQALEEVRTVMALGDRIQLEQEIFRKRAATVVQGYRTKDLTFRAFRNEALEQYRTLFDLAARYTYLAANSYDYETGLLGTTEGQAVISKIVSSRSLGDLTNGQPQATVSTLGDAGLAGTMAQLQADWSVAEGRLGINNPDQNGTLFSLRQELFRIMDDPATTDDDNAWQQILEQHMVSDIMLDPDAAAYCRGLSRLDGSPVPGIVIPFSTTIEHGKNFFGLPLAGGDHAFSASTFATKIYAVSAVFEGYIGMDPYAEFIPIPNQPVITEPDSNDPNALSATPYMYLIPTGVDMMRAPPLGDTGEIRFWKVQDQALPLPYNLGANAFSTTQFFDANGTLTEEPWILRKHQAFRAVDDPVFFYSGLREEFQSSRLVGRSAWNTSWKIIIPAYALLNDEEEGLNRFAASVDDIKIFLRTYSHSGN